MQLSILENGSREGVKAAVHGLALGLVALMGAYNAAAWLQRRQDHLAINTLVYAALVLFEYQHVAHHRAELAPAVAGAAVAVAVAAGEAVDALPAASDEKEAA